MKIFMLKSFCIAALMFISVLAGMQMAGNGIHKMKGYNDSGFENAVAINEKNTTILGHDISSHDLAGKKQRLEEISSFNVFSMMGKKLSDGISNASEKLIETITK